MSYKLPVRCPHCDKEIQITVSHINRVTVFECSECKEWFTIIPTKTAKRDDNEGFYAMGLS